MALETDLDRIEPYPFDFYDREGNIISLRSFAHLHKDPAYVFVAKTHLGRGHEVMISTVWLGSNHAFAPDRLPLIFETMVFGWADEHDDICERYATEAQAHAGHLAVLRSMLRRHPLRYRFRWHDAMDEALKAGAA